MSRPTTPHGVSPRGSYVNLLEGREDGAGLFSPSKIEKERLRAEAEVNASLLKEKDGEKKEEPPVPVGSSGMSSCHRAHQVGTRTPPSEIDMLTMTTSASDSQLLCSVHHDDRRQQIRRLWISIHNDLPM